MSSHQRFAEKSLKESLSGSSRNIKCEELSKWSPLSRQVFWKKLRTGFEEVSVKLGV